MTHVSKKPQDERFYTRLISDDETKYVDTSYTIGELEETLDNLTNSAIFQENPASLKIASVFAFTAKRFEEVDKERSMYKARFEVFREAVEEIKELPAEDIKETLERLLEKDEDLAPLLSMLAEMM